MLESFSRLPFTFNSSMFLFPLMPYTNFSLTFTNFVPFHASLLFKAIAVTAFITNSLVIQGPDARPVPSPLRSCSIIPFAWTLVPRRPCTPFSCRCSRICTIQVKIYAMLLPLFDVRLDQNFDEMKVLPTGKRN